MKQKSGGTVYSARFLFDKRTSIFTSVREKEMKKLIVKFLSVLFVLLPLAMTACGKNSGDKTDYGTLTISDVEFECDKTAAVSPVFSKSGYAEAIAYTSSDNNLVFNGNEVSYNAVVTENKVIPVTAKTSRHTAYFSVTVKPADYGTLTIENIEFEYDRTATVTPVFSKPDYSGEITYTFSDNNLAFNGNELSYNAVVTETTAITVTATTANHTAVFTVTVKPLDYGTLKIGNYSGIIKCDVGSSFVMSVKYSVPARAEDLTFDYTGDAIEIRKDGNGYRLTAKEVKSDFINVTAYSEHFRTEFKVEVTKTELYYDSSAITTVYGGYGEFDISRWSYAKNFPEELMDENITFSLDGFYGGVSVSDGKVTVSSSAANGLVFKIKAESSVAEGTASFTVRAGYNNAYMAGNDENLLTDRANKLSTYLDGKNVNNVDALFVGDSFFNPGSPYGGTGNGYWSDFYTTWANKNAYTVGISSAVTEDFEALLFRLVVKYNPKNVVLHIGTNDIFDAHESKDKIAERIKTLVTHIREYLPETNIYWFTIEPRGNQSGSDNENIKYINSEITGFAGDKDYFTVLDSYSWCFNANGSVNTRFFRDGVHPLLANYKKYVQCLVDTGFAVIPDGYIVTEAASDGVNPAKLIITDGKNKLYY